MSMISEQVKELRELADGYKLADKPLAASTMHQAADTIEFLSAKLQAANEELERWHTDHINEKIKNPFAYTSTLICHNCGHKDEYIEELEAEIEELQAANMEHINPNDILKEIREKAQELSNHHWGDDERNLVGKGIQCMCVQSENIINKHMERSADCGGWIECESGKLPDKEVICCDVCGEIIIGYIHETYESEQTGFSAENSHEYMYNCVKWMEKPKP